MALNGITPPPVTGKNRKLVPDYFIKKTSFTMKTITLILACAAILFMSCKNDQVSEIEQKRKELEEKRKELKEKKELAAMNEELKNLESEIEKTTGSSGSLPATSRRGRILNEDVIMRSAASVKATKLGNFTKGETVSIIKKQASPNSNEAVVQQTVDLYSDNNELLCRLPQGKAVIVEEHSGETVHILYEDPKKGKVKAKISSAYLDFTSDDDWYQVRRNDGREAWVLGKFLLEI